MLHSDIADSFTKIAHTIATNSVIKIKLTIALYILLKRSSALSKVTRMSITAIVKQIEINIINEI